MEDELRYYFVSRTISQGNFIHIAHFSKAAIESASLIANIHIQKVSKTH